MFAKDADGNMGLRVIRVNDADMTDGIKSQSSRSAETLFGMAVKRNAGGKLALRLVEEKPYLSYNALLTQAGTAAPTRKLLGANELGGTPALSYVGVGVYRLTITGKFTVDKTSVFLQLNSIDINHEARVAVIDDDVIEIRTFDEGVAANDILADASLKIEVYR